MNEIIDPPTAHCLTCDAASPDKATREAVHDWALDHLTVNRTHSVDATQVSVQIMNDSWGPWTSGPQFRTTTITGADA